MPRNARTALIATTVFLTATFAVSWQGAMAGSLDGIAPSSLSVLPPFIVMALLILRMLARDFSKSASA